MSLGTHSPTTREKEAFQLEFKDVVYQYTTSFNPKENHAPGTQLLLIQSLVFSHVDCG